MSSYKKYINELSKKFGYHATWEPTTKLKVGDIGKIEDGVFHRLDNIKSLGFSIGRLESNTASTAVLEYQSKNCREFNLNGASNLPKNIVPAVEANADFLVSFGAEGGVYFKVKNIKTQKIQHQLKLMQFILSSYVGGIWDEDWAIINELKTAGSAVILFSDNREANASLKAAASVSIPQKEVINADTGLKIVNSKGMSFKLVTKKPITPFFKLLGIKKGMLGFGKAKVTHKGTPGPPASDPAMAAQIAQLPEEAVLKCFDTDIAPPS